MKDHEVAYNAASWEAMSSMLDAQAKSSNNSWMKWSAAALILLLLGVGTGVYLNDDSKTEGLALENAVKENTLQEDLNASDSNTNFELKEELRSTESDEVNLTEVKDEEILEDKTQKSVEKSLVKKARKDIKKDIVKEDSFKEIENKKLRETISINKLANFLQGPEEQRLGQILVENEEKKTGNRQIEYLLFNPWDQLAVVGNFDERLRLDYVGDWNKTLGKSGEDLDLFAGRQLSMSYESALGIQGNQGIGFYYQNSSSDDLIQNNRFTAIYSYIMTNQMKGKLTLSPALSFNQLDLNQNQWNDMNELDSITPNDSSNVSLSLGVNYEYNRFFLYLNTYNLSSIRLGANSNYADMSSHYVLGYHIPVSKNFTITPMFSAVQNRTEMNVSPKLFIDYKQALTAGVAYQDLEQIRFYLGTKFARRWNMQASYGMNTYDVETGLKSKGTAQFGVFYQLDVR